MKWDKFRRSENVEDFTDPNTPVPPIQKAPQSAALSINEQLSLVNSQLAKDAGSADIKFEHEQPKPKE